jgi:hypothetical protein
MADMRGSAVDLNEQIGPETPLVREGEWVQSSHLSLKIAEDEVALGPVLTGISWALVLNALAGAIEQN